MTYIIDFIQFLLILGIGYMWFSLTGKVRDPQKEKITVTELEKIAKRMKTDLEEGRRDIEVAANRVEKLETRVYLLETSGEGGDEDEEL